MLHSGDALDCAHQRARPCGVLNMERAISTRRGGANWAGLLMRSQWAIGEIGSQALLVVF